jgi:hypothetical protein
MSKQITESDLLAELVQAMQDANRPVMTRLPGDIDYRQIRAATGLHHARAQEKMRALVETGSYRRLWVTDEDGKRIVVFRKVEK